MVDKTEDYGLTPSPKEGPSTEAVGVGDLIDDATVIAEYSAKIRTLVNNAAVWYQGMTNINYFPDQLLDIRNKGGPTEADLTATITAAGITSAFGKWTTEYTAVRKLRWLRNYVRQPYTGDADNLDQTNVASLLPKMSTFTRQWINGTAGTNGTWMAGKWFTLQDASNMFTASVPGVDGNLITLTFDGIADVDAAVTAWNVANAGNMVTYTGPGTVVPVLQTIVLAEGASNVGENPIAAKGFVAGTVQVWWSTGATVAPAIGTSYRQIQVTVVAGDVYQALATKTSAALAADASFGADWNGPVWNWWITSAHTCFSAITSKNTYVTVDPTGVNGNLTSPNAGVDNTGAERYIQDTPAVEMSLAQAASDNDILQQYGVPLIPTATAVNFNNYVTELYDLWNVVKNNTVTFRTYYCHGNCHSNCHSNRGHR